MKHIDSESSPIAKLTAKQRDCLDLAVLGKSPREIARILDISRSAVDQRLLGARRLLGASTREEAVLIYAKASGRGDLGLGDSADDDPDITTRPKDRRSELSSPSDFEEVPIAYDAEGSQIRKDFGGDWGRAQRIAIIVILAVGILAIVLIGLSVSQSLSRLFAG
ncbi:MAG: helix-turn-helix transcriptional regulator [Parasphingorhabdus sp.]|nr:helix-turn-helix transcriptional regulator [Parasphingorhabdus sp.]